MAPSVWLDGYLAAGAPRPPRAGPEALCPAAAERFPKHGPEAFLKFMANRYKELRAEYGETRALAAIFLGADDLGMMEWARGCAQGVKILKRLGPPACLSPRSV